MRKLGSKRLQTFDFIRPADIILPFLELMQMAEIGIGRNRGVIVRHLQEASGKLLRFVTLKQLRILPKNEVFMEKVEVIKHLDSLGFRPLPLELFCPAILVWINFLKKNSAVSDQVIHPITLLQPPEINGKSCIVHYEPSNEPGGKGQLRLRSPGVIRKDEIIVVLNH